MRVELQKDKELEEPLIDLARMPQNSTHPLRFSSHANPKTHKEEMKEGEESFPIPDKSRSKKDVQMRPKKLWILYYANRDPKAKKYPNYTSELASYEDDSVFKQSEEASASVS